MGIYEFGPFQVDAERLLLLHRGEPVALGPKVVETLLALIEHPGELLAKQLLLDRIWPEGYVDEANLAQNIYVLRKVLREHWDVSAIETIPRRGYRFVAEVRLLDDLPRYEPIPAHALASLQSAPPAAPPTSVIVRPRASRTWWKAFAAALALALLGGLSFTALAPHRVGAQVALTPKAARLYEIGRYYWNLRTRDGLRKSVAYFARAVDADPKDARGYAALASANALLGDYDYGPASSKAYFARAKAYAAKALALDGNCAEAYAVLGMIATESSSPKGLEQGIALLRRALALDPKDAPAHEWYGVALLNLGHFAPAYAQLQQSAQLDPLSVATTIWLGEAAYLNQHYDAAIAYAREAIDFSPIGREAFITLGLAYEARGNLPAAIHAFQRLQSSCRECRYEADALLADAYARSHRLAEARSETELASAHADNVEPQDLAAALFAIGKRQIAFRWLRRVPRSYLRAQVAVDPRFDALRNDPELGQVAQKPA